jgi:branched-chain amino acid transport system permease protein
VRLSAPRITGSGIVSTLRARTDLGLLVVLLGVTFLLPRRSLGLYALGVTQGAVYALYAAAVILIYRSNRVINFAVVAAGSVGATLTACFLTYDVLTRKIQKVCGCWQRPPSWWQGKRTPNGGISGLNVELWVLVAMGVLVSVLLTYGLYALVVRFLANSPRLVVTLATLFFVFVCSWLLGGITSERFATHEQQDAKIPIFPPRLPFVWSHKIGIVRLEAPSFLVLLVTAVLVPLLAYYLLRSRAGVAIRGAADNPARVASLGVSVLSVTGRVWILAGLLSGVASMLLAFGGNLPRDPDAILDPTVLVRVLAVVVFARFASMPVAALAAVVLGIVSACVQFAYSTTAGLDAALLVIIGLALILQRAQRVRADADVESGLRTTREVRPIPAELRHLPEVRKWLRTLGFVASVVLLGYPFIMSASDVNLASYCLAATMIFLSVLILTGWAGQISLGQMAFAGAGAWTVGVTHLPFLVALLAGAVAGAVLALVTGIPGLRVRGLYLAIITLALSLSVTAYLLNPRFLGKHLRDSISRPIVFGMDLDNEQVFYYVMLLLLAAVTAMVVGLRRSAVARALIAARDNEAAAQAFGINLLRARLSAYAISGAIAGLAGALMAFQQHSVIPETFSAGESLRIFLFSTLGGLGAIGAPLLAGAVFAATKLFMSAQVARIGIGFGGLAVLLFAPGGLSELVFNLRDNLLRGVARRRRIIVPSLLADERDTGIDRARLPIKPNTRGRGGGTVFIPPRYRLDDQYAIRPPVDEPAEVR